MNTLDLSKEIWFAKEENGGWYVDLDNWYGPHANLAMVAGADDLLEYLHRDPKVCIDVIPSDCPIPELEEQGSGWFCAVRTIHHLSGSTYDVKNLPNYNKPFWICPVTLFVLHKYPAYIYIRPSEGCKENLL